MQFLFCLLATHRSRWWLYLAALGLYVGMAARIASTALSTTASETKGRQSAPIFDSAPCSLQGYVCGLEYFGALYAAMQSATTDVIFQGWQFELDTPLLGANGSVTLLSAIEETVARGVSVHVLLWANFGSEASEELHFEQMDFHIANIVESLKLAGAKVLVDKGRARHFWQQAEVTLRWSYHMKAVVVDQRRAFVGGIDLANSRVDSAEHLSNDARRPKKEDSETGYNEFWQDVHTSAEGSVAHDIAKVAADRWRESCEQAPSELSDCSDAPKVRQAVAPAEAASATCAVRLSGNPGNMAVTDVVTEIQDEYVSAILAANRSIYLEHMYLSSALLDHKFHYGLAHSKNLILRAIWTRLQRAVDEGEVDGSFSVTIVLPIGTEEAVTQLVNVQSLWSKKNGLIHSLRRCLVEKGHPEELWKNMLGTFCLGTVSQVSDSGTWRFMSVFIHSKVLLVDGDVAVIGSANINDRSMLGSGDAEIDLRIDDRQGFPLAMQRKLLGFHAPSGHDDRRLAASLWETADANWAKLEGAWPHMFLRRTRRDPAIFSSADVAKVTFGQFIPHRGTSGAMPELVGHLLPYSEDWWGPVDSYSLWARVAADVPWIGGAFRMT
eukprot:TRINITY_DN18235_c0_g1_i1.p1 TRINITY_DN18235_c0_g1~~TRINITY_DN18235_c0_g1_i1.p1  ORF type:complete len:610 (-),score=137.20 TRINITY_DN18235_c0_g1_i1:209-2038(-)